MVLQKKLVCSLGDSTKHSFQVRNTRHYWSYEISLFSLLPFQNKMPFQFFCWIVIFYGYNFSLYFSYILANCNSHSLFLNMLQCCGASFNMPSFICLSLASCNVLVRICSDVLWIAVLNLGHFTTFQILHIFLLWWEQRHPLNYKSVIVIRH